MVKSAPIELTLGAFDLFGDGENWRCETLASSDLSGNPVPVEVAIRTLIQDGSVSFTEKYDNATITVLVCLSAPDSEELDKGAAALFAELGRPNVLTYRGPQAFESVAWDVVNSRLDRTSDDLGELRGDRFYTITLTVLPFRRATTKTVSASSGATVGTGRQRTGSVAVGGSARTPGTLHVSTTAPNLGEALIYVWRNPDDATGYVPALQNAYGSLGGSTVSESTNVSGRKTTLDPAIAKVFQIPRAALPAGEYHVMARIAGSASGTTVGRVKIEARTDNAYENFYASPTFSLAFLGYEIKRLGRISLPTADLPADSTLDITLLLTEEIDSGAHIVVDEVWLFHRQLGALVWISFAFKHLWILPPDASALRPRIYTGAQPDMSDARLPTGVVQSWEFPRFSPPAANHLTVTTSATDATTSLEHYPRLAG